MTAIERQEENKRIAYQLGSTANKRGEKTTIGDDVFQTLLAQVPFIEYNMYINEWHQGKQGSQN